MISLELGGWWRFKRREKEIELQAEVRMLSDSEIALRRDSKQKNLEMEKLVKMDLVQKFRMK